MSEKRRGLGRGIGALIPSGPSQVPGAARPIDVFFESSASAPSSDEAKAGSRSADTVSAAVTQGGTSGTSPSDVTPLPGTTPDEQHAPLTGGGTASNGTASGWVREDEALDVLGVETGPEAAEALDSGDRAVAKGLESGASHQPAPAGEVTDQGPAAAAAQDVPGTDGGNGLVPVPGATFAEIPVDAIAPNARQPRQVFDEDELEELAASIREVGVLQPIVVRRVSDRGQEPAYELIMGERRWRASQLAGNGSVPAIIRDTGDSDLLRDALLENLHRTQLNALEEAAAYQQLLDDFGCTHDELATRIARSRPQISNTLRLLKLPPLVQRRVAAGVLSAGHARALLGLADGAAMERLAQRVVAEGLSVRATEEIVALGDEPVQPEMRRRPRPGAHSETLERVANRLTDHLDTRVKVTMGQRKGRIAIEFAGIEDLDRILTALGERPVAEQPEPQPQP